jgi:hypothetical protein
MAEKKGKKEGAPHPQHTRAGQPLIKTDAEIRWDEIHGGKTAGRQAPPKKRRLKKSERPNRGFLVTEAMDGKVIKRIIVERGAPKAQRLLKEHFVDNEKMPLADARVRARKASYVRLEDLPRGIHETWLNSAS